MANQSAGYIGYKHKPYNPAAASNILTNWLPRRAAFSPMFKSELHCCLCRFGGCAYSSIVYFQENMIMFSEIFIINCTYGNATVKRSMTMKVHQLQHLPMFVEAFGPLWAFSCFPYENSNGQVKGLVHGTYKIHCITGLYNIVYIRPVSAFFFFYLITCKHAVGDCRSQY